MGTTTITLLCFLFLSNGIVTGMWFQQLQEDRVAPLTWKSRLLFLIGCFIGFPVVFFWFIIELVKEYVKTYITSEIKFYWRVYRTKYFENAVAKDPNALWRWNQLWRNRKSSRLTNQLKRHVLLLNKKFNYNYEEDKLIQEEQVATKIKSLIEDYKSKQDE